MSFPTRGKVFRVLHFTLPDFLRKSEKGGEAGEGTDVCRCGNARGLVLKVKCNYNWIISTMCENRGRWIVAGEERWLRDQHVCITPSGMGVGIPGSALSACSPCASGFPQYALPCSIPYPGTLESFRALDFFIKGEVSNLYKRRLAPRLVYTFAYTRLVLTHNCSG